MAAAGWRKVLWVGAGAYALLLTFGSLMPSKLEEAARLDRLLTPTLQNFLHAPAYAGLTVLALLLARGRGRVGLRTMLWIALGCWAYGVLIEFAQAFVPGRTASVMDAMFNAAGVAAGLLAARLAGLAGRGPAARPAQAAPGRREQAAR